MSDFTDDRRGAYDPVSKDGSPQPHQAKDASTPQQKAQWGADVRAEAVTATQPVLPERLIRPAKGPLNSRTGRKPTS